MAKITAQEGARKLAELLYGKDIKKSVFVSPKSPDQPPIRKCQIIGIATEEELRERARLQRERQDAAERKIRKHAKNYIGPVTVVCPCGVSFEVENYRKHTAKYHSRECARKYRQARHPVKYVITPEMDEQITAAYRDHVHMSRNVVVRTLAEQLGLPRWKVCRRARDLDLVPTLMMPGKRKPTPWSEPEKEIVRKNARFSVDNIRLKLKAAGFERSPNAVKIYLKRFVGPVPKENYTATSLAKLFNIDGHTIVRWIRQGYLKASRTGTARTARQGGDSYLVRPEDVREFVINYLGLIDFRKLDKFWLVEMLTGREIPL